MSLIDDLCGCSTGGGSGVVTCSAVNSCVNKQLTRIEAGLTSSLPNFCGATAKCIDTQLGLIAIGSTTTLPNFDNALFYILRNLPGYTSVGDIFLSLHNNVFEWQTVAGGGGGYTDEQAQDAVGTILGPEFTYNDGLPLISLDVANGISKGTYVQLGQTIAAAGNPAALLANTEIPLGDFFLTLNNKTGTGADQSSIKFVTSNSTGSNVASIDFAARNIISLDMLLSNTSGIMQTSYANSIGDLGATGYSVSGVGGHFYLADMRGGTTYTSVEVGGVPTQTWNVSGDTSIGLFGTRNTGFGGIAFPTAYVDIAASTTTKIPLKIPAGVDPTANYQEGAIWQGNDLHFYGRLGGINKQLDNDYNFTPDTFIQNQFASAQTAANYWIGGHGRIDDYLQFNTTAKFATGDFGLGTELIVQSIATPIPHIIGDTLRLSELRFFTRATASGYPDTDSYPSSSYIYSNGGDSINLFAPGASGSFSISAAQLSIQPNSVNALGLLSSIVNIGGFYPLIFLGGQGLAGEHSIIDIFNAADAELASAAATYQSFSGYVDNGSAIVPLVNPGARQRLAEYGIEIQDFTQTQYKSDFVFRVVNRTITAIPQEKLRIKYDGRLIAPAYATGLTAPTTTGTKHMVTVDANGLFSHETIPTGGGGGVSSVGLSMPSAFTVTGSPVTGSGTLGVTGAGTTAQYIRGDGSLATFAVPLSSLLPAIVANTINNRNFKQDWNWDTHSTGTAFTVESNSTGAATGSGVFKVSYSGVSASPSTTATIAATISNSRSETISANTALFAIASNSTVSNTAISAHADGGPGNWAIYTAGGDVEISQGNFKIDLGDVFIPSLTNFTNQNRLVGQYSVDGKLGYIAIGAGLDLSGGILSATGAGATDTNFAISDLTASGDRTHDWASNDLTFINLDHLAFTATTSTTITCANIALPSITNLATQNRILGQFGTGGRVGYITVGSGLDLTTGVLSVTSSGGSVTDITVSSLSPLFTTGVATSTTTPAVTFTLSNAGANTYFGNATSGSTAPSYTAAGALTVVNDTNLTATLGANAPTSLLRSVALTLAWSGTLGVARGGTNLASYAVGDQIVATGVTTLGKVAIGTAGQLWRVNAGVTSGEWFTPTYISAAVTSLNGLTAATQTFAVGTSGTDFNISSVTSTHTFNIPSASLTNRGVITTGAQSIEGYKTYNVSATFNNSQADSDLIVKTQGSANAMFVDASTNRVGIFTATPAFPLDIVGNTQITSGSLGIGVTPTNGAPLTIGGSGYTSGGIILLPSISSTTGSTPSILAVTGTIIEAGSGTHSFIAGLNISAPTITAGLATVTNAASLYINGAPTAVTTAGITYSILVAAGTSRFNGDLILGSGTSYSTGGYDMLVRNQTSGRFETVDPDVVGFNSQSGTSYTLVITDKGEMIRMTNVSANTLTVPPNASVAFSIGTQILVYREGGGQTSIAPGVGVTINSADGALKLRVQHSVATLIKIATNTWVLSGDIVV